MAWPPPVLPINRTDALAQQANHPGDHNTTNQAVNDIVTVVRSLAPGYVAHAFAGAEQSGIQTAFVSLTNGRVDYVESVGHKYLILGSCQMRKAGADGTGIGEFQLVHSAGGVSGPATMSCSVVPFFTPIVLIAVRVGTTGAPVNIIAQARTDNGYVNVSKTVVVVVDLGPVTP